MNKLIKDKFFSKADENEENVQTLEEPQVRAAAQEEDEEALMDQQDAEIGEEAEILKVKKTHKHRTSKPTLGVTQRLSLVTQRTLSTTERLIQSLTKAYEHIFVGDEVVEEAKFEKEYALKYYSKNDYKNALKHFESCATQDQNKDVDVLYMMGVCHLSDEDYKKAAECFKKADELKIDDFDIVTQLAKCLLALEDFEGALNYYRKSAEISPDEGDTFYHMANCLEKLDRIEEAKKMYKKAIDLNPREAVYYHALGLLYENMGDHKDAIVCFKKAMDLERSRGGAMKARE